VNSAPPHVPTIRAFDRNLVPEEIPLNAILRRSRPLVVLLALVLVLAACGSDDNGGSGGDGAGLSGTISVDGSSTVAPLTNAAGVAFNEDNPDVQIPVGTSGTGGGFKKFCAGETDMSDASRPIKEDDEAEAPACKKNGITYEEIQVANDGISVVVNKENDWAKCLTVEQLNKIWGPDAQGKVTNWNQVDPKFPDQKLTLLGPGTASGTFDFFTDQINGEEGSSRSDYNASEDDNVIVQGVEGDKGGLGYFGLSYYEENKDKLNVVQVDGGDGCVTPSTETVQDGSYTPLSRPLFIYPSDKLLARPEGIAFVQYYVDNSADIATQALFVPMTAAQLTESKNEVAKLAGGSGDTATT
jgi:phosphate transport system substrate-binding protein